MLTLQPEPNINPLRLQLWVFWGTTWRWWWWWWWWWWWIFTGSCHGHPWTTSPIAIYVVFYPHAKFNWIIWIFLHQSIHSQPVISFTERALGSRRQTSDNMDRWSSRGGESQRRERKKKEDQIEKRKSQSERKGRKVAKHCVFPVLCGSAGAKSKLSKAADAEPPGPMRNKKMHGAVAWSRFWSQNAKKNFMFGAFLDVEMFKKVHGVVAQSKFPSQEYSKTPRFRSALGRWDAQFCSQLWHEHISMFKPSNHFWTLRCKCTPLWRAAHIEVQSVKNCGSRTTFGRWAVEKWKETKTDKSIMERSIDRQTDR